MADPGKHACGVLRPESMSHPPWAPRLRYGVDARALYITFAKERRSNSQLEGMRPFRLSHQNVGCASAVHDWHLELLAPWTKFHENFDMLITTTCLGCHHAKHIGR